MSNGKSTLSRRRMLQLSLSSGMLASAGLDFARPTAKAEGEMLRSVDPRERKLLFVVGALGGASIIDSFLPVAESEVGDYFLAQSLNTFPDSLLEQVPQSALRVPGLLDDYGIFAKPTYKMADFVRSHGQDLAVIAHEVSSVNHAVGQQRSLSGAGVNRGRTLMEAAALRYGGGLVLPSCNMAADGFLRHGADPSVPAEARHELISTPLLFATGTHGYRGIAGAPPEAALERARMLRKDLEGRSYFGRTFADDGLRNKFLYARNRLAPEIERARIFDKLILKDPGKVDPKYGIAVDPLTAEIRKLLPDMDSDATQAQVALAFLLAFHGVSASVTLGFSQDPHITPDGKINATPIAFDFSHNNHRQTQNLMWSRTASLLDVLITLLKTHDYLGDPALGKMWDRSLIYVATEFGRDKARPFMSGGWATGHNLNNGSVILSPLVRGNAVYGGVDPKTCNTFGFDPATGQKKPDSQMTERDVYGIIAHALDLDSPATGKYPAVVR